MKTICGVLEIVFGLLFLICVLSVITKSWPFIVEALQVSWRWGVGALVAGFFATISSMSTGSWR